METLLKPLINTFSRLISIGLDRLESRESIKKMRMVHILAILNGTLAFLFGCFAVEIWEWVGWVAFVEFTLFAGVLALSRLGRVNTARTLFLATNNAVVLVYTAIFGFEALVPFTAIPVIASNLLVIERQRVDLIVLATLGTVASTITAVWYGLSYPPLVKLASDMLFGIQVYTLFLTIVMVFGYTIYTLRENARAENALSESLKNLATSKQELESSLNQLQETQTMLVQASRMSALGEMAGGIAHEINSPLTIISLRTNQLKTLISAPNPNKELINASFAAINSTVTRISKIIHGLRTFARDGSRDPFVSCDLDKIASESLALCQERFKNDGIALIHENHGPLPLRIQCREVEISQVLINLLNNAYDAVQGLPEKWVKLEVTDFDDQAEIRVTDSGPGLRPEVAGKIFQPFFTTKEIGKGTGLGLSISKGLIEQHGGTLRVDTASQNTSFVITLPKSASSGLSRSLFPSRDSAEVLPIKRLRLKTVNSGEGDEGLGGLS